MKQIDNHTFVIALATCDRGTIIVSLVIMSVSECHNLPITLQCDNT